MSLRRREIVALIAGVAGWPLCGLAEQPELTRHVGVLMFFPEDDPEGQRWVSALKGALQQLSWIDGKNLHLELRWVADPSLVAKYAAELVSLTPDIILTTNTTTTKAVQQVSTAVPIVFVGVSDPVSTGVVASLAKPGANATGFANLEFAIGGKWLELLKEIAPYVEQAHVILDANNPTGRWHLQTIESAAPAFGIVVSRSLVRDRDEMVQHSLQYPMSPQRVSSYCPARLPTGIVRGSLLSPTVSRFRPSFHLGITSSAVA